jgi:hypothetical protein
MNVSEAMRRLGRSESTIQAWCKPDGPLRAVKVWTVVKRGDHFVTVLKLRIDPRSVSRLARRLALPVTRGKE